MADHSVVLDLVGRKLGYEDLRVLAVWLGESPSELIDIVMSLSFCVPKYQQEGELTPAVTQKSTYLYFQKVFSQRKNWIFTLQLFPMWNQR